MTSTFQHNSKQSIAERAHELWTARGCPQGSADEDWLEAERQLALSENSAQDVLQVQGSVDSSLIDTFPASDPPASHIPDTPPSNAEDKWAAAKIDRAD